MSDNANDASRATTATTWASYSRGNNWDEFNDDNNDDDGGNDNKLFQEIANYGPAPSSTAAAAVAVATDDDGSGSRQSKKNLLISFVLMVIIGMGNKIFQKLQAIPIYNYPNLMNLIKK